MARPRRSAISGVIGGSLASPRTPSVPNSLRPVLDFPPLSLFVCFATVPPLRAGRLSPGDRSASAPLHSRNSMNYSSISLHTMGRGRGGASIEPLELLVEPIVVPVAHGGRRILVIHA